MLWADRIPDRPMGLNSRLAPASLCSQNRLLCSSSSFVS
jgi:hypothetical protein